LSAKIADKHLLYLEQPQVIVCEWVPFDPNIFEEIAERLEAKNMERGILLTDEIDTYPESPVFIKTPVVSTVSVVKYEFNRRMVLEAFLGYPEEVEQIEKIGLIITDYGLITSGLKVEDVRGNSWISVDDLSKIVFDVADDTSKLLSSILSIYHRRILNIIYPRYREGGFERRKFIVVKSDKARIYNGEELSGDELKKLVEEPYIDEIKQIIGPVISFKIEKDKAIVNGTNGMLIIGEPEGEYWIHAALRSLQIFLEDLTNYFWQVWEMIGEAREQLIKRKLENIQEIRSKLVRILSDLSLLKTTLTTLQYSLSRIEEEGRLVQNGLLESLEHYKVLIAVKSRVVNAQNIFESLEREIDGLLSLINMRIEASLDKQNVLTFWLSIIFGAFGSAQLIAAIAPMFLGTFETILLTGVSIIVPIVGGYLYYKRWD